MSLFTPPITVGIDSSGKLSVTGSTTTPPPPALTFTVLASGVVVKTGFTSLVAAQLFAVALPPNTSWTILDSNGSLVASGIIPPVVVPPPVSAPPVLVGWGGLFADSSDLDANLDILQARGYNAFRCMIYNADFPRTPSLSSVIAAVENAKSRGMWIILDYHGYSEPFSDENGWLQFWNTIISNVPTYDKIVYEPCNEPVAPDVATLASAYSAWLTQCRNLGDNHFVIISVNNYFSGDDPALIDQFPLSITDQNTLWSWHEYYMFQWHPTWTVADAKSFADGVAAQADKLLAAGKIPFMSEFGADAGSTPAPPDVSAPGSAGFAPESLVYANEVVAALTARGVGYMLWTADNWTDTPGAGATGALNVWGQLVTYPGGPIQPPPIMTVTYTLETSVPIVQNVTLASAQAAILTLPASTTWTIFDSNNLVIATGTTSATPPPPPTPTGPVEQVVMVVLENTSLNEIYVPQGGACPYLSGLADQYGLALQWSNDGVHPSEPNYIRISFGDDFGVSADSVSTTRPPPTILDLLVKAGKSYKIIQNGDRGFDHNAFLLERPDISHTVAGDTPDVIAAVQSGTNFVWFTPADNQNMHDNTPASGDAWLATWIPQLLQAMSTRNSLLIITTDEGNDTFVFTCFAGPAAKLAYKSSALYNHYSFGKLIESIWGGSGLRNCDTAAAPTEFLR